MIVICQNCSTARNACSVGFKRLSVQRVRANCLSQPMKSCLRGPRPPRTSCFRQNALIFRNGTKADSAVFKPLQSILWSLLLKLQILLPPSHKTKAFSLFFFQILNEMVESLQDVQGISRVLYDLTAKPPGTTEWE